MRVAALRGPDRCGEARMTAMAGRFRELREEPDERKMGCVPIVRDYVTVSFFLKHIRFAGIT